MTWRALLLRSWELHLLLAAGALFMLPGVPIDADVVKTAFTALGVGTLLILCVAWRDADAVTDWFTSGGGRLYVGALACAALGGLLAGGFADPMASSVVDRVLGIALALLAAVLGLGAARRWPLALPSAVGLVGLVTALFVLAQAVGWDETFSPPAELTGGVKEIVGLAGNSTRAGALLALSLSAAAAVLVGHRRGTERLASDRVLTTLVILLTAALLLTQGRAGRLAAGAGLVTLLVARRADARAWARVLLPLAAGLAVALLLGGSDVLLARKLPASGPILSGEDVTTRVRLALWESGAEMLADGPLLGHGLGRFRHEFGPYRDPVEAALPGLQGQATVAWHPHNELLLGFLEGGWIGGVLLLLFTLLTLRRAWRAAREDGGGADLAALGVLVAGTLLALLQDAWISPGTALPFFAAAGYVWAPLHGHPERGPRARAVAVIFALVLVTVLALLAWPRVRGHGGAWRFVQQAEADGAIDLANFELMVAAADAAPRDEDLQLMLYDICGMLLRESPPDALAGVTRVVTPPLRRATERLRALGTPGFPAPADG